MFQGAQEQRHRVGPICTNVQRSQRSFVFNCVLSSGGGHQPAFLQDSKSQRDRCCAAQCRIFCLLIVCFLISAIYAQAVIKAYGAALMLPSLPPPPTFLFFSFCKKKLIFIWCTYLNILHTLCLCEQLSHSFKISPKSLAN